MKKALNHLIVFTTVLSLFIPGAYCRESVEIEKQVDYLKALSHLSSLSRNRTDEAKQKYIDSLKDLIKQNNGLNTSTYHFIRLVEKNLEKNIDICGDIIVNKMEESSAVERRTLALTLYRLSKRPGFRLSDQSIERIISLVSEEKDHDVAGSLIYVLSKAGPQKIEKVGDIIFSIVEGADGSKPQKYAILALIELLKRKEFTEQERAVKLFVQFSESETVSYRQYAATAFGAGGVNPEVAVPVLLRLLDDNYFKVRKAAAYSLRGFGPEAKEAIPLLVKTARSETGWGIQSYCIHALQSIGKDDPEVLKAFSEFLDNPRLKLTTLSHLSGLGENGAELAPRVAKFLENGDLQEKRYAVQALGYIGTAAQIPDLNKLLKDSDAFIRKRARVSIAAIEKRQP